MAGVRCGFSGRAVTRRGPSRSAPPARPGGSPAPCDRPPGASRRAPAGCGGGEGGGPVRRADRVVGSSDDEHRTAAPWPASRRGGAARAACIPRAIDTRPVRAYACTSSGNCPGRSCTAVRSQRRDETRARSTRAGRWSARRGRGRRPGLRPARRPRSSAGSSPSARRARPACPPRGGRPAGPRPADRRRVGTARAPGGRTPGAARRCRRTGKRPARAARRRPTARGRARPPGSPRHRPGPSRGPISRMILDATPRSGSRPDERHCRPDDPMVRRVPRGSAAQPPRSAAAAR